MLISLCRAEVAFDSTLSSLLESILVSDINMEILRRLSGKSILVSDINMEILRRLSGKSILVGDINMEILRRLSGRFLIGR